MLGVLPPIFMANTKIIYGYNFVALLKSPIAVKYSQVLGQLSSKSVIDNKKYANFCSGDLYIETTSTLCYFKFTSMGMTCVSFGRWKLRRYFDGILAWCKSGNRTPGPGTSRPQDLGPRAPQNSKVGPETALKFKSGTSGPPPKFKSGTPGPPSKFKIGTPLTFFNEFIFSEYLISFLLIYFFVLIK